VCPQTLHGTLECLERERERFLFYLPSKGLVERENERERASEREMPSAKAAEKAAGISNEAVAAVASVIKLLHLLRRPKPCRSSPQQKPRTRDK
jgi:hypothetical protein